MKTGMSLTPFDKIRQVTKFYFWESILSCLANTTRKAVAVVYCQDG